MAVNVSQSRVGAESTGEPTLRAGALKLPAVLMQGITHIAPAVGIITAIQFTASLAGIASPLAFLLAFVIILLLGFSLTQLARHLPSAGGYYTYVSRTVHPRAGWLTSWLYFLYDPTVAAINLAFMGFLWETTMSASYPHGPLAWSYHWWVFFIIAGALISVLAYIGVEISTRTVLILGAAEITIMLVLAIWGLADPGPGGVSLHSFNPSIHLKGANLFLAIVFSIFAFTGFESVAPLAEEAENPKRNLPRAIIGAILFMGFFYVFVAWGVITGWGTHSIDSLISSSQNPVLALAKHLWGWAWIIVFIALINSILAVSIACNNASTRVFYAMARSGSLPSALAKVHPKYKTPVNAIWLQVVIMFVFGLGLGFWIGPDHEFFMWGIAITLGMVLVYSAGNLGVYLFYRGERRPEFNWIKHLIIPLVSTLSLLYVGYKTLNPLPTTSPEKYAPWPVLAWLLLGIVILLVMRARGREEWLLKAGHAAYDDFVPGGGV